MHHEISIESFANLTFDHVLASCSDASGGPCRSKRLYAVVELGRDRITYRVEADGRDAETTVFLPRAIEIYNRITLY